MLPKNFKGMIVRKLDIYESNIGRAIFAEPIKTLFYTSQIGQNDYGRVKFFKHVFEFCPPWKFVFNDHDSHNSSGMYRGQWKSNSKFIFVPARVYSFSGNDLKTVVEIFKSNLRRVLNRSFLLYSIDYVKISVAYININLQGR